MLTTVSSRLYTILENVAINDVLPLKAARRYAIATRKIVLGVPEHQRPHFDGFIYTRYAAPP